MKLLGWMHRKLRQSNNDVFKEFGTVVGGTCNGITGLGSPDHVTFVTSATEYFAGDTFSTNNTSPPDTDLFTFGGNGLLTIGTLGIAAVAVDIEDFDVDVDVVDAEDSDDGATEEEDVDEGAVTPKFTYPPAPEPETAVVEKAVAAVEAIAEKDDDTTTEDDLMVVSAELEKVLGGRDSGATGDLVASARVSFALGVDCPLQGFLFGSPVSDAGSRQDQPRGSSASGGRRTSLGELFMRTRFAEEKVALVAVDEAEDYGVDGAAGGDMDEKKAAKGGGSHKTVKKRKVKDDKVAGGDGLPASAMATKSKFQKIFQIFHRKVYPESTALTRSLTKKSRKRGDADEAESSPKLRCRTEQRMFSCCATSRAFGGRVASPGGDDDDDGDEMGSKSGHWIRTDADYLVLEL